MSGQTTVQSQTIARPTATPTADTVLQRQCACGNHTPAGGECHECQEKHTGTLQRAAVNSLPTGQPPSLIHEALRQSGRPLDPSVRETLEPSFGYDLSRVRVHSDDMAARAAEAINARAFALGNSIWFGHGEYQPHTPEGLHLLTHEVAHTIQQPGLPSAPQAKLTIGSVNDPSEIAADRAADAVLQGNRVAGLYAGTPTLRRQPRTAPRRRIERVSDDVRLVYVDDQTRYRITRRRRLVPHTERSYFPPSVTAGADRQRMWMRVEWCQGTRGRVDVGADVPQQLQNLVRGMAETIISGGDANAVLRGMNLTPYVDVVIARSGTWRLTGGVEVTVGQQGVTGGGGRIGVSTRDVDVGVRGRGEAGGGWSVEGTVTIPTERRPEEFTCPTRERVTVVELTNFDCQMERYAPPRDVTETHTRPVTDTRSRYLYFQYARDTLNPELSTPEVAQLRRDLGEGFQVSQIRAYTSPEGPMAARGRFQGNEQLARDRARAAMQVVRDQCPPTAEGGADRCFVGGERAVTPEGEGELYTIVDEAGREVEGEPLAAHAVGEFTTQPEEEQRRTPEVMEQLGRARTPGRQAHIVYPRLRRALITLVRTRQETTQVTRHEEGGFRPASGGQCPPDIIDDAFPRAEDVLRGLPG